MEFDRKEMTRFYEFAQSPYHFKHEDTRLLIYYLSKIYPDFTEKTCNRYHLYKVVFKSREHDQPKLALLFTYAMKLLEEFLIIERLNQERNTKRLLLLRKLRALNEEKSYFKLFGKYQKKLEQISYRDVDHYRFKFLLSEEVSAHPSSQSHEQHIIQRKQDNLDVYFMAEKLRDICEMHVRSQLVKLDYDPGLTREIIAFLEANIDTYKEVPAVYFYYHLYELIVRDREASYDLLKSQMKEFQSAFRRKELQTIYDFLRNYCLLRTNQGDKAYLKEVFRLYQEQLDGDLMFDHRGVLAEWHYKNIITAGINLGEMSWVENFIRSYKEHLDPTIRENAFSFNLANFYYANKKYDQAQDLLIHVEYTDLRYSLNAKMLLLRLYYEKDEYDALQSLLESFRLYIKRNKEISEERYIGYNNLIKFARRLYNVQNHVGYSDDAKVHRILSRIEEDFANTKNVFYKSWLQNKIAEIHKKLGISKHQ